MELDNGLWVDDMVHTKTLQLGDAELQIATKDEWAGYLLASGASSSRVLGMKRVSMRLRRQRGTLHTSFFVSPLEGVGMKI